ncbi:NCS2 family permease [Paludibacterium yongneupense]|uniref:NCS2 family permease n=1 Tax=Paludibacterium yongneupense TaxID=400061 RepID=UPI00048CBB39|nr:NCS2 family permease [Paludibacterium yongneupense]
MPTKRHSWLERRFDLSARGSTVRTEIIAGLTTFMACAYLVIVIPGLLAAGGMDKGAATSAVIIVFALGSILMAFYGNLPFIVGPGVGGSAIVGVTLAASEHVPWQVGLGIAFWSGVLFMLLTALKLREVVTRTVPLQIKLGLTSSIGLFVTMLGLRNAGLVLANAKTNALMLGNFTTPGAAVALSGLAAGVFLQARKIPGGILWSILVATALGIPLGVTRLPASWFSWPHSPSAVFFELDPVGALHVGFLPYLFVFFAAEFFSTMGTTLAVGDKAGMLDRDGNMAQINTPFVVDSIAATVGTLLGIPALTSLIESAAGVESGGRTGLTALAAATAFLLLLLLTPLALMIPKEATAPALLLIGLSMFSGLRRVDMDDFSTAVPVLLMMLLTLGANSFATGIAGGLLCYVIVKLLAGRRRDIPSGLYIVAVPLAYYFWTVISHS